MRIILCGYSRHGKGEVGTILSNYFGLRSFSSSWVAKERVYDASKLLRSEWRDAFHAWENRHYNRGEWYKQIQRINNPDKTTLAELVWDMPDASVYDGMRDREELRACLNKWPDVLAVWVHRPTVLEESSDSNTIRAADCHFTLHNSGTLPELQRKVKHVFSFMEGI